ncbi:probable disease resistance RPP8-like protein 4 [Humulus lupulus]|uniref:probable disease resistance RPP8-like protein 4 n=1 Tax=Humulus lupulus TaxID=3486 RepID=UPI002B40CBC4|nr:probable disease resistance RPP8-like protein 4 [Humulus lupulus]
MADAVAATIAGTKLTQKICNEYRRGAFSRKNRQRQFDGSKSQLEVIQALSNCSNEESQEGSVEFLMFSKLLEAKNSLEDVYFEILWLEEVATAAAAASGRGTTGGIRFANLMRKKFHEWVLSRMKNSSIRSQMKDIDSTFSEISQLHGMRRSTSSSPATSIERRRSDMTSFMMKTSPPTTDYPIMGFEECIEKLGARLTGEGYKNQVIVICGEVGSGKTVLAGEIYQHEQVRHHFTSLAWVTIPDIHQVQLEAMHMLKEILTSLDPSKSDTVECEVEQVLSQVLEQNKCLVVIDNIQSPGTLCQLLKKVFPKDKDSGSKLLLTSQRKNVARDVDKDSMLFKPSGLDQNTSKELILAYLQKHDIDLESDIQIEALVRKVVKECAGLQPTILPGTAIGLAQLLLRNKDNIVDTLRTMLNNCVKKCILKGKVNDLEDSSSHSYVSLSDSIKKSYNHFFHDEDIIKKSSFKHLASFPENFVIRVTDLCQLLMVELGPEWKPMFSKTGISPEFNEEEAYFVLADLEEKSMVSAVEFSSTGGIKAIVLNGIMRDFCLSMAEKDNLVQVIDIRNVDKVIGSSSSVPWKDQYRGKKIRRLVIDVLMEAKQYLILSKDTIYNSLSSFICFKTLPAGSGLEKLLKRFPKLRILKLENQESFVKVPKSVGKNVKFLMLFSLKNSYVNEVPSSIGKLMFLQTLDLRTKCALKLPNVLWKLRRLRHLYLPHEGYSVKGRRKLRLDGLVELRKLVNILIEDCDFNILMSEFVKLEKLVILVRSNPAMPLQTISSSGNIRFKSLKSLAVEILGGEDLDIAPLLSSCMESLEKLRLDGIRTFPAFAAMFPPQLLKITLMNSYLRYDPMMIMGKVPNLKFLRLGKNALSDGVEIVKFSQGDFTRLQFLSFEGQQRLTTWSVEGCLPRFESLEIVNCENLNSISEALRRLPKLKQVLIQEMPPHFRTEVEGQFPYLTILSGI